VLWFWREGAVGSQCESREGGWIGVCGCGAGEKRCVGERVWIRFGEVGSGGGGGGGRGEAVLECGVDGKGGGGPTS